jgi:phosphoglycolate phosphatase
MTVSLQDPLACVIFDLDGTLIDSVGEIAESVNTIRRGRAARELPVEEVRAAVGHGARILCERILPDILRPDESIDDLFLQFRATYIEIASDASRDICWLPGALDLLGYLEARSISLAILTNKPRSVTDALMPRLDAGIEWSHVICPEDVGKPKPDPTGLRLILEKSDCSTAEAILIGDSAVDFATGAAAGVRTVGRRHGYGVSSPPEPDLWVDHLADLIPD